MTYHLLNRDKGLMVVTNQINLIAIDSLPGEKQIDERKHQPWTYLVKTIWSLNDSSHRRDGVIPILTAGRALTWIPCGTLNSIDSMLDRLPARVEPIREAKKAAKKAVTNMGNVRFPRSRLSCLLSISTMGERWDEGSEIVPWFLNSSSKHSDERIIYIQQWWWNLVYLCQLPDLWLVGRVLKQPNSKHRRL